MADHPRRAQVALPATTTAPRSARRFAAETLRSWGAVGMVERAELVVSELVTNAIRHGRTAPRLLLVLMGDCLRIEVADAGSGGAVRRNPRPDDVGGRGLFLVDAISDRWGSDHDGVHHVVWCEMAM